MQRGGDEDVISTWDEGAEVCGGRLSDDPVVNNPRHILESKKACWANNFRKPVGRLKQKGAEAMEDEDVMHRVVPCQ